MISAVCWVPRGVAKAVQLETDDPTEDELAEMQAEDSSEADERDADGNESETASSDEDMDDDAGGNSSATDPVERAKAVAASLRTDGEKGRPTATFGSGTIEDALAELDMEHYDSDGENGGGGRPFGAGPPGMSFYRSNLDDPYITLEPAAGEGSEDDDDAIRDTDLIILAARNEDDVSHLEVWVYEEEGAEDGGEGNLYVHHDVMLPAFPLCVTWLDCDPLNKRDRANLAAIGTFSPGIEIWDLDVVDSVEPLATLGGEVSIDHEVPPTKRDLVSDKKKKKKKSKKAKGGKDGKGSTAEGPALREGSHTDAVLGLAWNHHARHVIASASADHTVKVWDITAGVCSETLKYHTDKVQAVAWNAAQATVLLTGGYDKAACMGDMRVPKGECLRWELSADTEALAWQPAQDTAFVVSTEDGTVAAFDARGGSGSSPLWRLAAHEAPACSLTFCPAAPGLMATASTDKKVKLWDVSSEQPSLVASSDVGVGALFSAAFCAESPFLIAAGGAKGTVAVWDTLTSAAVASKYRKQARRQNRPQTPATSNDD